MTKFIMALVVLSFSGSVFAAEGDQLLCADFIVNELAEGEFEIRNFPQVGGKSRSGYYVGYKVQSSKKLISDVLVINFTTEIENGSTFTKIPSTLLINADVKSGSTQIIHKIVEDEEGDQVLRLVEGDSVKSMTCKFYAAGSGVKLK